MAQPENFAVFGPLVAACLWLAARGLRGDGRSFAVAGLLAGLACIGRNDAYFLGSRSVSPSSSSGGGRWSRRAGRSLVPGGRRLRGALLRRRRAVVAAPARAFGSISPTASTGNALWLTDIRQWNSITADVSFQAWLTRASGHHGQPAGGLIGRSPTSWSSSVG